MDRVFVTETQDKQFEVVRALDLKTGKQIWETQWEGSMQVPFFAASNGSWIRATPSLDGDRLYVAGIRDVLVCLDASSGEILWKVDFVADTGSPLPQFGFASSPLVHGDHIYVQAGASLAKLDKLTGKIVWQRLKDDGGMYGSAFSSPIVATIAEVEQLIVQTRTSLAGVSPSDGTVLWTQDISAFRGMNILTPTVVGNSVFTSCYGGRSTMFTIDRQDNDWKVTEAWSHKSQGYMSSPLVIGDYIYLHLKNRRFVCLNSATGAEQWTTTPFGKYWSMIGNGSTILALDESGDLLLIQASPEEFKLLDRVTVGDNAWAHLAVVGEQIYVRNLDSIKAFAWK
ncbi:PQQ-binding-like beta-propeller repeat protein [Aureliella helgolandensis]|nr:PQQ-binding-like beta-propeller repeat protein [Aureliella helgolandensis]